MHGGRVNKVNNDLLENFRRRDALSITNSCSLFGGRLDVQTTLRWQVLKQLHQYHPGVGHICYHSAIYTGQ